MFWISILRPSATALRSQRFLDGKATSWCHFMRQHAVRPSFDGFFHVLRVFQIGTPALEPSISPQQLRMRGYCYCGDTYGRYGVKLPNRTAGLTGPDDFVMILVGWLVLV